MKKDYIYLAIIALLIGLLIYFYYNSVPISLFQDSVNNSNNHEVIGGKDGKVTRQNVIDYSESLNLKLSEFDKFFITLNNEISKAIEEIEDDEPATKKMLKKEAIKAVDRSLKIRKASGDSTRALFYSLPKLLAGIMKAENVDQIGPSNVNLFKSGMYVYHGVYSKLDSELSKRGQTMSILQLVDKDNNALENHIYNFGKLCPSNCPEGELIIPTPE